VVGTISAKMSKVKTKRWYFIAAGLAAIVIGAWALGGGERPSTEPVALPDPIEPGAFGKISDFELTRTVEGQKQFEMTAKVATYFDQKNLAEFSEANITFFPVGGGEMDMTAGRGIVKTDSQDIEVTGEVVIRSSDGYRLTAPKLVYAAENQEISTDQTVELVSRTIGLVGKGLKLSLTGQTLKLEDGVKATLLP
jgi:lipopolysaccharide export system protein LptC